MTDGHVERGSTRKGKVSELGESGLLSMLRDRLPKPGPGEVWAGDDTAVLSPPRGDLLFTVDTLVEGVDFDLSYSSGRDVAWKALAANASDIAAMCGRPMHAVTSLSIPRSTDLAFVEDLIAGLNHASERWGIALVGGDISEAAIIVVTIALLGSAEGAPVLRSGAKAGDSIYVTGALGGAAAGLALLRSGSERKDDAALRLKARQLRPEPRVAEALWLAGFRPTAMIDLSDGLARDLSRILDAGGLGCRVGEALIPVDPDLSTLEDMDPLAAALTGGEDLELLFTIDPANEVGIGATAPTGTALTRIGEVTEGARTIGEASLDEWRDRGWDHLR